VEVVEDEVMDEIDPAVEVMDVVDPAVVFMSTSLTRTSCWSIRKYTDTKTVKSKTNVQMHPRRHPNKIHAQSSIATPS
jgi:hypothetical protein